MMPSDGSDPNGSPGITRKAFITRGAATGAAAASGAALLSACGAASVPTATSAAGARTPVRGGTLTAGFVTAAAIQLWQVRQKDCKTPPNMSSPLTATRLASISTQRR